MTEILIENAQQEEEISLEHEKLLKSCVEAVLSYEECDFDAEVSITIVDE